MSDSPTTLNKLEQLPYRTDAIIDVAQQYHNEVCSEYECTVYTKEKVPINFDYGLYAGYSFSSFDLHSDYFRKMNNDFLGSRDLFFGLFLNIMDPDISERFSIQLDLIFQKSKYVFDSTYYQISYVRVPFSIKYTYPVKQIKPSFQLGVAYNKWYNYEAKYIIPEHVIGEAIQERSYQYGLLIGAEITYQLAESLSLFALGRYERYRGKPWNNYKLPNANGDIMLVVQESVEANIDFLSFSVGLKF